MIRHSELEGIENEIGLWIGSYPPKTHDQKRVVHFLEQIMDLPEVTMSTEGMQPDDLEIHSNGVVWKLSYEGASDQALQELRRRLHAVLANKVPKGGFYAHPNHQTPLQAPHHVRSAAIPSNFV